ncbi:unnamed protein product, partial [Amoebophrya sp. A25]|eukprot:GSA25T00027193001.1
MYNKAHHGEPIPSVEAVTKRIEKFSLRVAGLWNQFHHLVAPWNEEPDVEDEVSPTESAQKLQESLDKERKACELRHKKDCTPEDDATICGLVPRLEKALIAARAPNHSAT